MLKLFYNYIIYCSSLFFKSNHLQHPKHKNKYFITYNFEGKNYNLLVSKRRGPNNIISIYGCKTEQDEPRDIYDEIVQYLGPNFDFHNIKYTPQCLGYYKITCYFMNDTEKSWTKDEIINL